MTKQQIRMPLNQTVLDNLKQIGLTPNEAEIYLALAENSPSFVAPLVKTTGKHRQMVYNALDGLLTRNLIVKNIKNGKFYYELSHPDRLVQMIKEQERIAQDIASDLIDQINRPQEQVEILKGSQAYQEALLVLTEIASQTGEYIIMNTIPNEFISFTASKLKSHIKALRDLKDAGVELQLLAFSSVQEQLKQPAFANFVSDPYTTRISTAQPEPPQTIWISGDHLWLRNHLDDPILIHIISHDLANRYRQYFKNFWDSAKSISCPIDK